MTTQEVADQLVKLWLEGKFSEAVGSLRGRHRKHGGCSATRTAR